MHLLRILAIALAAAFPLAQLAGCAPTQSSRATGQVIDDATITARVNTALLKEGGVSTTAVNVDTYRGTVQLSGFVESQRDKELAERVARSVPGVQSVDNALRIAPERTGSTSAR